MVDHRSDLPTFGAIGGANWWHFRRSLVSASAFLRWHVVCNTHFSYLRPVAKRDGACEKRRWWGLCREEVSFTLDKDKGIRRIYAETP